MRALRRLIVVLIVLAGLFVAADRVAVKLAEGEVADRISRAQGVSSSHTSVDIQGFPFLTQIAGKDLDRVDVRLNGVTAQAGGASLHVRRVNAHLRDVRLGDGYSSAVADRAKGSVLISYADLSRVAPGNVRLGWGGEDGAGKGRVKVTGSIIIPVINRELTRSVYSTVSVSGGDTVRLHAQKVPGAAVPGVEDAIRKRTDFTRKLTGLPAGLRLGKVEATRKGILLSGGGTDVQLTH